MGIDTAWRLSEEGGSECTLSLVDASRFQNTNVHMWTYEADPHVVGQLWALSMLTTDREYGDMIEHAIDAGCTFSVCRDIAMKDWMNRAQSGTLGLTTEVRFMTLYWTSTHDRKNDSMRATARRSFRSETEPTFGERVSQGLGLDDC